MMHLSMMMMAILVASGGVASREADGSSSYYTDEGARRLVHFDGNSGECRLFGDRIIVEEILHELAASESPVAIVEAAELTAMISRCAGRNLESGHPSLLDFPHVIYPGTKWCGSGNAAVDLEDLGPLRELDICCRNHDLCPEVIESGESKHNLTNETPFAVTRCDCSENFRSCLKAVGDESAAREVGTAYFSSGLFQCFKLAKPVSDCLQWKGLVTESCQKYSFKEEGEEMHQFFDMSSF